MTALGKEIALLVLAAGLVRPPAADNTLTDEEKKAGWTLLFDGQTTGGWRGYKKEKFPDGWTVAEGSLIRVSGGGDIVTEGQYENFELQIDWRITEGTNSGIMYRVVETEKTPYMTGPELQILDDDKPVERLARGDYRRSPSSSRRSSSAHDRAPTATTVP